jgi:hypothetical protein
MCGAAQHNLPAAPLPTCTAAISCVNCHAAIPAVPRSQQMLANKTAGMRNWYHPGSLCSGGRYANGSAAMRAVQAARGMLACAWHIATGGRQAEAFRWRATDSSVAGVSPDINPPVWCLGLAGSDVLAAFQQAEGTGLGMINWHAKVRQRNSAALLFAVHNVCFAAVVFGCAGILSQ